MDSFSPGTAPHVHPIWKRNRSEKVKTERDFREFPIREASEISIWLDFFRPKFLPFLGDHHGCTGGKDRFGKYFTQPDKSGPTGGCFSPTFRITVLDVCEFFPKAVCSMDIHSVALHKWKQFHLEKTDTCRDPDGLRKALISLSV
jgi:hypothetical protein